MPYADYVNVGKSQPQQVLGQRPRRLRRADREDVHHPQHAERLHEDRSRTCTHSVDGVSQSYDCSAYSCTTTEVPAYEQCSGGDLIRYRWYGCVLSRVPRDLRLSDLEPSEPYVGTLDTSQKCLTEIVPLTSAVNKVKRAIRDMAISIDGHRPSTYIPAGVVWGVNVLSPTEPFTEGRPYDGTNVKPRKVLVLMTDGENTLRFDRANGRHVDGDPVPTNEDTIKTCDYAASRDIEIFAVAFGELSTEAERNTCGVCATTATQLLFGPERSTELNDTFERCALAMDVRHRRAQPAAVATR